MSTELSNKHRYFIQFMLSNGCVVKNKALSFFEEISPDEHSLAHFKTLILEINRVISAHSYKIATTCCEITGEEVLVWLNTKNDQISKSQIAFSPVELEYFHALLQEIVTSDDHRMVYPRAVNISSTLTATLSRENGEKALLKWLKGGYFVKKEKNVYLGPRTILEFTSYLRTNIENCSCDLCSELVFVGQTCSSCNKIFHSHCINKYLHNRENCPNCKSDWVTATQSSMEMEFIPQATSSFYT